MNPTIYLFFFFKILEFRVFEFKDLKKKHRKIKAIPKNDRLKLLKLYLIINQFNKI